MNVDISAASISSVLAILALIGAMVAGWVTFQSRLAALEERVNDLSMTVSGNNEILHTMTTRQALLTQRVDDVIFATKNLEWKMPGGGIGHQ